MIAIGIGDLFEHNDRDSDRDLNRAFNDRASAVILGKVVIFSS